MVEVDGGEAGREDQQHAGWAASTDLLGGQVELMLMIVLILILKHIKHP